MTQLPEDHTNRVVRTIAIIAAVGALALAIWAPIYLINRDSTPGETIHVLDPDALASVSDGVPGPAAPAIGSAWAVDFSDGLAQVTVHKATWVKTGKGKGADPKQGNYLVLDISVTAASGTVTYDSQYFTARDANNAPHLSNRFTAGYTPVLKSGDLTAGATVRGRVVFDMPRGASTVELAEPAADVLATWQIAG